MSKCTKILLVLLVASPIIYFSSSFAYLTWKVLRGLIGYPYLVLAASLWLFSGFTGQADVGASCGEGGCGASGETPISSQSCGCGPTGGSGQVSTGCGSGSTSCGASACDSCGWGSTTQTPIGGASSSCACTGGSPSASSGCSCG